MDTKVNLRIRPQQIITNSPHRRAEAQKTRYTQESEANPFERVNNGHDGVSHGPRVAKQVAKQQQSQVMPQNRDVPLMQNSLPEEVLQINMGDGEETLEPDKELKGARSAPGHNNSAEQRLLNQLRSQQAPQVLALGSREENRGAGGGNLNLLDNSNAADHDNKNFFIKSDKGDGQSIRDDMSVSECSRVGGPYPNINIGQFRRSSNPRRAPAQQVQIPQIPSTQNSGKNSQRDEKIATFSPEALSKLVYDLLKMLDLVKFLTTEDKKQVEGGLHGPNSDQTWMKAGERVLETVKKHSDKFKGGSPLLRSQHMQIEPQQVRQIFSMLNNFAMYYLQLGKQRECSQILHLAWQIDKNYQSSFQSSSDGPRLQAMFYSNFSTYHLVLEKFGSSNPDSNSSRNKGECQDLQLAKKYIHAAIQLSMSEMQNQNTGTAEAPAPNSKSGLRQSEIRQIHSEMNCAINYNNRAVIQMKNGCFDAARVHSKKAIQLMEPTVFGLINSGFVTQVQQSSQSLEQASASQKSKEEGIFHELLQVLLVSYFNLAMSMDRDLKSRDIYLRGMQLLYQYVPNCQHNVLYRKFQQKYCRKMYDNLEKELDQARDLSTIDLNQPLPEILPLDMRSMPDNQSLNGLGFQENRVTLWRPPQEGQALPNVNQSIFSESVSNLNGGQAAPKRRSFLLQDVSAASMFTISNAPIIDSLTQTQKKHNFKERFRAEEEPATEQLGLHRLNQKSSVMNNSMLQPIQPYKEKSQDQGRPSKCLEQYENLRVKPDFMNISKFNSRGGDDKPPPTEGPSVLDSDRRYIEEARQINDRLPEPSLTIKYDDEGSLRLRVQRTLNDPKQTSILPDGRAQEFEQLQPFAIASEANEPNLFVPDEKIVLQLNRHPKSQISKASNPMDNPVDDSINNRVDDSASNITGGNQLPLPRTSDVFPSQEVARTETHPPANPNSSTPHSFQPFRDTEALNSQKSNDSPMARLEQTAKFGQCHTGSVSYSVSPGIQSQQAQKYGATQMTPRSGSQNVSNFQKQEPGQTDENLVTPKRPDRYEANALEEKSKELERERERLREENEAWRKRLQEETQKEIEKMREKEREEMRKEREAMREEFELMKRLSLQTKEQGRYGQHNKNDNGMSEVSHEGAAENAENTKEILSQQNNDQLVAQQDSQLQPSQNMSSVVDTAKQPSMSKITSNLSNQQSQSTPGRGPQQDLSSRSPRTPSNNFLDQCKKFQMSGSEEVEREKEDKTKVANESLQQSILKKQIKAMHHQVDVFVTEDTLRFQSSKKNTQDSNQTSSGVRHGIGNLRLDGVKADQAKLAVHSAYTDATAPKDSKLPQSPPLNPIMATYVNQNPPNKMGQIIPDKEPFSYQRISEHDEQDVGFVELSILQKKQGFNIDDNQQQDAVEIGNNAQQAVLNLQKLIRDFRQMQEQHLSSRENLHQNQQQQSDRQLFNINQQQIDALIYLREHNMLYSPHNLWKFNKRFIDEIRVKKRVTCEKIISLHENGQTMPIKVQIEATCRGGPQDLEPQENMFMQQDNMAYKGLMKDNIVIKMSAFRLKSDAPGQSAFISQEFSLLELQSTLYFLEGLSLIDPSSAMRQSCSQPFFLVDSFEELCQHVLFHYVQIGGVAQSESNYALQDSGRHEQDPSAYGRQSSRAEQLVVDFSEEPNGIFTEPLRMKFLMHQAQADDSNPPDRADINNLDLSLQLPQVTQNDQIQGAGRKSALQANQNLRINAVLSSFMNSLPGHQGFNCSLNFFHVHGLRYKMLITPTFDSQTMLFIQILRNQKNQQAPLEASVEQRVRDLLDSLEALQKIQPKNVGSLQIDLEFKDQKVADEVFRKYKYDQMQFEENEQTGDTAGGGQYSDVQRFESIMQINDSKEFFEKYFAKIVEALDDYLMEQFGDWFDQFNQHLLPNYQANTSSNQANRPEGPQNATQSINTIEEHLGNEDQLLAEHKRHKRLFNLIVYLQIVTIKLTIGQKLPSTSQHSHHMEMMVIHKNQKQPKQHDLTAICLLTTPEGDQIERSLPIGINSATLMNLFSEQGLQNQPSEASQQRALGNSPLADPGQDHQWGRLLDKNSLTDHYNLQLMGRLYLKAMQVLFEDPDASESECNLSNSSESIDSQSDVGSSQKANKVAQPKKACIKIDNHDVVSHKRIVYLFQSQMSGFKYPVPVTCELLAWKRNDRVARYLGVRVSVHDVRKSEDQSILLAIDDDPRLQPSPQNRGFSLEQVMKTAGFNQILKSCIDLVPKIETKESAHVVQTNSDVARDYLGFNQESADHSNDRIQLLVKHDKIDFPDSAANTPSLSPPSQLQHSPASHLVIGHSQSPHSTTNSSNITCKITQFEKHVDVSWLLSQKQ